MNSIGSVFQELAEKARKDEGIKQAFLKSRESEKPYYEFCKIANELGYELSVMDLVDAGNTYIETLARSVNGGGANHTVLYGSDDFYTQFFAEIE